MDSFCIEAFWVYPCVGKTGDPCLFPTEINVLKNDVFIQTVEYYSALKRKECLLLENIENHYKIQNLFCKY